MSQIEKQLAQQPESQISLTDPDSRSMMSQAKGTGVVGYNVQVAVDTKHHLIVAHEVTNVGHDRGQLSKLATAAREAMDKPKLRAYADRGYFNGPQIKQCDERNITAFVPKPLTSGAKFVGRFDKRDFIYIAKDDEYRCPAGQRAIYRFTREEGGLQISRYWSSACPQCPMKPQCTPSDYRRISRWEHEDVLERMQRRLDRQPEAMTLRRRTVEHVFGTLKYLHPAAPVLPGKRSPASANDGRRANPLRRLRAWLAQKHLDASVLRSPLLGAVVRDRLAFASAFDRDAGRRNAAVSEIVTHAPGTSEREWIVHRG